MYASTCKREIRYVSRLLVLLISALTLSSSAVMPLAALAGGGAIREEGGVRFLDFCVSIGWNASGSKLDEIQNVIQSGSDYLYDATDGNFAIGKVVIHDNDKSNPSPLSTAEIRINNKEGRAYVTQAPAFGETDQGIVLFRDDVTVNFDIGYRGQVIAHEFGHSVWGLLDEYKLDTAGPNSIELPRHCAEPPDVSDPNLSYCVMDGNLDASVVILNSLLLNEFCTNANHDSAPPWTTQSIHNGFRSCWQTIEDNPDPLRRIVAPLVPLEPSPGAPPVEFEVLQDTPRRVILCLDRSNSISTSDFEIVKSAALLVADLIKEGTHVGVVSFGEVVFTTFSLSPINDESARSALRSAIEGLQPPFGNTPLVDALGRTSAEFGAVTYCEDTVVLISDGKDPNAAIPIPVVEQLAGDRVTVYTVAPGQDFSFAKLAYIANATSGEFYRIESPLLVQAWIKDLVNQIQGAALISGPGSNSPEDLPNSTSYEWTSSAPLSALIDSTIAVATFLAEWADDSATFEVTLQSPSGDTITQSLTPVQEPYVDFRSGAGYEIFVVEKPILEVGLWTVSAIEETSTGTQCELSALSDNRRASIVVTTPDQVPFPTPIAIQASPRFDERLVSGAAVTCQVIRPDLSEVYITLQDDGDMSSNGDRFGGDGIYSAMFSQYAGTGVYGFNVSVDSQSGMTVPGESFYTDLEDPPQSVPAFFRQSSAVVPSVIVTDAEIDSPVPDDRGLRLTSVHPNPFGADQSPSVSFVLPRDGHVSLRIFDVAGRIRATLTRGQVAAGRHTVRWHDLSNQSQPLGQGIYFLELVTEYGRDSQKVVIIR